MTFSRIAFLRKTNSHCVSNYSTLLTKKLKKVWLNKVSSDNIKPSLIFFRQFNKGLIFSSQFYKILGVSESATQKEIKSAYYALSKQHHPDVSADPKSHSKITEINEAYETLGDEAKRLAYDQANMVGYNQYSNNSTSYPNYSYWTQYASTEKYYNRNHYQQQYYADEYEFSQWYDEKQKQYNAKKKTYTSNKHSQNSGKYNQRKKTTGRDSWYYEQQEEYDILNEVLKNKNKRKNSKAHQKANTQESKQERPRDTDHEPHYQYYEYVLKEHLKKSESANNGAQNRQRRHGENVNNADLKHKSKIFTMDVDDFFNQYEDFKTGSGGKNSDIDNAYDRKVMKLLAKNFENVLQFIDDEPNKKNRSEYLKRFLQNFKHRNSKRRR